ncbi:DUF1028 domain-containing protein (plasmid) [Comamonadaceae bacterium OTU4NAUVB1]|nr:DUF1028 domain-containing protein [Comamonadaceae bacterium OTU4NAUVB1]
MSDLERPSAAATPPPTAAPRIHIAGHHTTLGVEPEAHADDRRLRPHEEWVLFRFCLVAVAVALLGCGHAQVFTNLSSDDERSVFAVLTLILGGIVGCFLQKRGAARRHDEASTRRVRQCRGAPRHWPGRGMGLASKLGYVVLHRRFLLRSRHGARGSWGAGRHGPSDPMTWSILARDDQGHLGVAIASRFFAVGALCVHTRRGTGALATQALMNPLYGPAGLDHLGAGRSADETVRLLTQADAGRAQRQLHVLPATGRPVAWTGADCVDWCGHHVEADFSVAGNMLAGPQVVAATARAYRDAAGLPLAERLLAAMAAGEAAGGDRRGKQAAALRIHADEDHPQLDLRVDDHEAPLVEVARLHRKSLERYQPFMACLAGRYDAVGLTDRGEIEARIARFHARAAGPAP